MIDRANALYVKDDQFRDVYMLTCASEEGEDVDAKAINGLCAGLPLHPYYSFGWMKSIQQLESGFCIQFRQSRLISHEALVMSK